MTTTYPDREVFENSPLALVAVEIRFTDSARLRQQQTRDELAIALEHRFPFVESLQQMEVALTPNTPPRVHQGMVLKNATSTESITVMSESLTYETIAYADFDALSDAATDACDALVAAKVRPAVRRIGLRYVNEVRVSDRITDVRQWARWIDERLIGSVQVGPDGVRATTTQSVTTFDLGGGRGLNVRFAALDQGSVVVPQFLLRPRVDSGPFFVLDFDGFHDFAGEQAVALSSAMVGETLSAVHTPCGTAFQRSITNTARALFRGDQS